MLWFRISVTLTVFALAAVFTIQLADGIRTAAERRTDPMSVFAR